MNSNRNNYLFFWSHKQRNVQIDMSCFSQWYPATIEVCGVVFTSAEQWMMAQKAMCFDDQVMCSKILNTTCPKAIKKMGRSVRNFDDTLWDKVKFNIVVEGNYLKFSQNRELGKYLKDTGSKILVEASPYDRIWGIGMRESDPNASNPKYWKGQNLLGQALMKVREMI